MRLRFNFKLTRLVFPRPALAGSNIPFLWGSANRTPLMRKLVRKLMRKRPFHLRVISEPCRERNSDLRNLEEKLFLASP